MEIDIDKPNLRRSTRKITPSLKALEIMENLKAIPKRKERVKKIIEVIPDIHMEYVEQQFNHITVSNPTIDPVDHLVSILYSIGIDAK